MNKICFLIIIVFLSFSIVKAQNVATPNAGFENWTQVGNHYDPNNWNTLNPNTSALGVFTCTRVSGADAHSGSYAIKLTTKSVFGITANGITSTATLITSPPYGVSGGIAYTGRPDSIAGWYKYIPASASDSGFAEIVLQDANGDTVGFSRFTTPNTNVANYTRFSRPVIYFSTNAVANSYWILTSSNGTNPVVNSALFIDDLDLIFNSSSVNNIQNKNIIIVTNNISNHILSVKNNSKATAQLTLTDAAGRIVNNLLIQTGENNFEMSELPAGIYFYSLSQNKKLLADSGKLIKL